MLHQIEYVHEKLRQLEVEGVTGDLNDQKLRELDATLALSRRRFRWTGYRLLAAQFVHAAGSGLRRFGEGLESWASQPVPASLSSATGIPAQGVHTVTPGPTGRPAGWPSRTEHSVGQKVGR